MVSRYITGLFIAFIMNATQAGEMVYRFVNPSFGGNPANGTFLLNQASEQNTFTAPKPYTAPPPSQIEQFKTNLERTILSKLSYSSTTQLFNSDGTMKLGANLNYDLDGDGVSDFTVNVSPTPDTSGNVSININDGITSTTLTVPSAALK